MQSCLTTGLIAFRIWRQYRLSREAGLNELGSSLGLLTVIRIVVESTMVFTVQQVVLCILYYFNSPAQWALHGTLVPSIGASWLLELQLSSADVHCTGVVFVLLSNRIHEAKKAPQPTFQLPWSSGGSMSTPQTTPNGTSEGESHALHRQQGHRCAVSDGLIFATPSISTPERVHYPTAPSYITTVEAVDLERGSVACKKSADDAILLVNTSSKVLG